MTRRMQRRAFVAGATAAIAAPTVLRAAEPIKIRCSLDIAPSHPRNVAIVDYMAKLEKASNGEIKTEVFHSGQLFADLNVSKAHQKLIVDLWADNITCYDKGSADSQARARGILEKNGVKFHDPGADESAAIRKAMMGDLESLIKDAKLSPEIVKLVKDAV